MIRALLKQINPDVAVGFLEGGYGLYLSSFGMRFSKVASARIDPVQILSAKGLRSKMQEIAESNNFKLTVPSFKYCTDNAAMIAVAGYFQYIKSK